jgi:sortase A
MMRRALWSIFVVAGLVRLVARRVRGERDEPVPAVEPVRAIAPERAVEPVRIVEPAPTAPASVVVVVEPPPAAPPPTAPARKRPRARRARRAIGAALVLAGILILADVGLTLAWQEPITALRERSAQHELARQLRALEVRAPPAPAPSAHRHSPARARPRAHVAAAARAFARARQDGQAVGELHIDRIGLKAIVVRGAAENDLKRGPGLIDGTSMPGQSGTTAIAGHRTTYGAPFRHIDALRRGDAITLRMPYGTFRYAVEGHVVVAPTDLAVLRRIGHDRLVLSACHPLYSVAQRIVVTARLMRVAARA